MLHLSAPYMTEKIIGEIIINRIPLGCQVAVDISPPDRSD